MCFGGRTQATPLPGSMGACAGTWLLALLELRLMGKQCGSAAPSLCQFLSGLSWAHGTHAITCLTPLQVTGP